MASPISKQLALVSFMFVAVAWAENATPAGAQEAEEFETCVNTLATAHRANGLSSGEALLVARAQISANAIPALNSGLGSSTTLACSKDFDVTSADSVAPKAGSFNGPALAVTLSPK